MQIRMHPCSITTLILLSHRMSPLPVPMPVMPQSSQSIGPRIGRYLQKSLHCHCIHLITL